VGVELCQGGWFLGDWMDVVYWQLGEGGWVTEKEHSIFLSFLFSLFFFWAVSLAFLFFRT